LEGRNGNGPEGDAGQLGDDVAKQEKKIPEAEEEDWKQSIKEITDWLATFKEKMLKSMFDMGVDSDDRTQLRRIANGDIYRHEISFLRDIMKENNSSGISSKKVIDYVHDHFDKLYPVGIDDDESGWK